MNKHNATNIAIARAMAENEQLHKVIKELGERHDLTLKRLKRAQEGLKKAQEK